MYKLTNRQKLLWAIIAGTTLTSGASYGEISDRAANKLSKFNRTGETVHCLSTHSIKSIKALDDTHFLVRANGQQYYLNETSHSCHGAARVGNRLQYKLHGGGQLCRNQIISVVDNSGGFTVGSCGLSSFERLEKIPTQAEE